MSHIDIKQAGGPAIYALSDILAGQLDQAIARCANLWALLSGNDYGQPHANLSALHDAYQTALSVLTREDVGTAAQRPDGSIA